jgi:hypothetical protein
MGNSVQILAKLARDAEQVGLTVSSQSRTEVKIANGANELTLSCEAAQIASPQGGVDPSVSPFLGIGIGNPVKIKMKSTAVAASTIADVLDSPEAAKVLALMAGFANSLKLENGDATFAMEIRGHADLIGMGQ